MVAGVDADVPVEELVTNPVSDLARCQPYRNPTIPLPLDIYPNRRNSKGVDLAHPPELAELREQLAKDISTLQQILDVDTLLAEDPWGLESIGLRNIYTAPLNLLQIELLRRIRADEDDSVKRALMVSIAGVAAGMRNTG